MDREAFREACARYATGVTVATVIGTDGRPQGLTANSFSSVSWNPPLVLICVDHRATVHEHFYASDSFAINVLGESQRELSVRFASPGAERFRDLPWTKGITGAPLIEGALAHLDCRTTHRHVAGDHTIFVGEVVQAVARDDRPLVYYYRNYRSIKD